MRAAPVAVGFAGCLGVRVRAAARLGACVGPRRDRGAGGCLVPLLRVFKLEDGACTGLLWVPTHPQRPLSHRAPAPGRSDGAEGHGDRCGVSW